MTALAAVARIGGSIAIAQRASRMRDVAITVRGNWDGDLVPVPKRPYAEARKALKAFPSIGPRRSLVLGVILTALRVCRAQPVHRIGAG